ncbi:MAG TPA: tRNA (cytidine(34)-2'-O)-methyltransferase [Caulobacteraceae bacterium]|nr:tRNA (cytidine(34)-2'-O)-methyltransferase [Caulobacteraceae bacterium]
MRLALFQPDIAQNVGAAIRLAACLGIGLEVIEPCAFPLDDRRLRRAALDYGTGENVRRHDSFEAFQASVAPARLILMTTRGEHRFLDYSFAPDDVILMGSESSGAPPFVHDAAAARLRIPLAPGLRSLNVVTAAAMVLGEALRQTGLWPLQEDNPT